MPIARNESNAIDADRHVVETERCGIVSNRLRKNSARRS